MVAVHKVIVGTGELIEESDLMEFRLLYEGELPPSGNQKRPREKHAIRRSFHPQLRRLWTIKENLRMLAKSGGRYIKDAGFNKKSDQEQFDLGLKGIGQNWNRAGFDCVPLVTADMVLRCSIDILLLRPEEDRFIFEAGDIDGQVKTLFDALRIPSSVNETDGLGPQEDEKPFFCLLEDDRLISEVHVTTDKLLLLPNQKQVKANDAYVVIHVKLNHKEARTFGNFFG